MKKIFFVIITLSIIANNYGAFLADTIMSKDMALATPEEFDKKVRVLIREAQHLLAQSVNETTKKEAGDLCTRISLLIELYLDNPTEILDFDDLEEANIVIIERLLETLQVTFGLSQQAVPLKIHDVPWPEKTAKQKLDVLLKPQDLKNLT